MAVSVTDALRQAVWAAARAAEDDVLRWTSRPSAGVPVGAASFDDHLVRQVTYAFCGEMSRTFDIERAAAFAADLARRETEVHNTIRPRDIHWQRDPSVAGLGRIHVLKARFQTVIEKVGDN